MGTIITLGIFGVITLILIVLAFFAKGKVVDTNVSTRLAFIGAAIVPGVIFGLIWLFSSYTNVPARTVGIVTEFGKATGTVGSGLNWVAPWAEITQFPTTNQALDLDATDGNNVGAPVGIKFDGGGAGSANVNMNWQIKTDNDAVNLWNNWKDFDLVTTKVVNQKAQTVVAEVVGSYSPEDAVKGSNIPVISQQIKDKLNADLASDGILVENVNLKKVDVDPAIQDRVNKQVEAQANLTRAKTLQDQAKVDAETNRIAQQQLTPDILANKCLDIVNNWDVAKNGALPAGWSCSGSNQSLVIPAK